jgi:tRNA-(ms[2]io[6]A)-hydroxylase
MLRRSRATQESPLLELECPTPARWVEVILADFDTFLLDHASCERKASATALALLSHYPDRTELVKSMIELAREELEHFHQVLELILERDLVLAPDRKDPYVRGLRAHMRGGSDDYFLDQLLVGGIVEARGCERFTLLARALPPGDLKDFYLRFAAAEARHRGLFFHLAERYFDADEVAGRASFLLKAEAELTHKLPIRAAFH